MSKKDREKKKVDNSKEIKEVVKKREQLTKTEKIIMNIIMVLGFVAIIVIVLVSIPWHGEKEKIAKKYKVIEIDNIYEFITFDELRSKIQNGDEFHVLLVSKTQENYDDYVFYCDYIVKAFNEDNESDIKIDKVYLLDTKQMLEKDKYEDQIKYLKKNIDKNVLDSPSLIYYRKTVSDVSVDDNATCRYKLEDYSNNIWKVMVKYFYDCYDINE